MIDNYNGIKSVLKLLEYKGIITCQEYKKCIKELEASWEEQTKREIEEVLERIRFKP